VPLPRKCAKADDELRRVLVSGKAACIHVLEAPLGRASFEQFLTSERSVENLHFYAAVIAHRALARWPLRILYASASDIVEVYIKVGSRCAVNLSGRVRQPIEDVVNALRDSSGDVVLDRKQRDALVTLFDDAQAETYHLMAKDPFPRYLRHALFRALCLSLLGKGS
jgi:hypothetical protein